MLSGLPEYTDTVIIGSGPSALILSFILHGNIPYYDPANPHPDPILHQKLARLPSLLHVDANDLTAHFAASRLSYSTQALPINVLLDTLLRPLADTSPGQYRSCVQWRHKTKKAIPHLVLGDTSRPGGQWADNPIAGSWDIGALSYADQLSLPGYSLIEHQRKIEKSVCEIRDFDRPCRREVAEYLAVYPEAVGISNAIHNNVKVEGISRTPTGFHIASHDINCKHLVLASGTFSNLIPPRPLLQPLLTLPLRQLNIDAPPLLVIGSGFTAADVILSAPTDQKIIHIFKWEPETHPSPLRACHPQAYPEYASVYRRMKLAAKANSGLASPLRRSKDSPIEQEGAQDTYEGLPNTHITDIVMRLSSATITMRTNNGLVVERETSAMQYVIGRRGSLNYLDENLRCEVLGPGSEIPLDGKTLRGKAEENLEVAPDVFITGSLTGDSLIRFAYGGCVSAAREVMRRSRRRIDHGADTDGVPTESHTLSEETSPIDSNIHENENGDTAQVIPDYQHTNGHVELRHTLRPRSLSIELDGKGCELWHESGCWSGGSIIC